VTVGKRDTRRGGGLVAPTRTEIEEVILELLAEDLGVAAGELREELVAAGPQLPVDSLIMVEILTRVEARFGIKVEETAATAFALRSVADFVELIYGLIQATTTEEGRGDAGRADGEQRGRPAGLAEAGGPAEGGP
jgi:acyl carrier protein